MQVHQYESGRGVWIGVDGTEVAWIEFGEDRQAGLTWVTDETTQPQSFIDAASKHFGVTPSSLIAEVFTSSGDDDTTTETLAASSVAEEVSTAAAVVIAVEMDPKTDIGWQRPVHPEGSLELGVVAPYASLVAITPLIEATIRTDLQGQNIGQLMVAQLREGVEGAISS